MCMYIYIFLNNSFSHSHAFTFLRFLFLSHTRTWITPMRKTKILLSVLESFCEVD